VAGTTGWIAQASEPESLLLALLAATSVLAYLLGELDDRGRIGPLPKALLQAALVVAPWIVFVHSAQGEEGFTILSVCGLALALVLQLALGIFDNMDGALAAVTAVGLVGLGGEGAPLRPGWIAAGAAVGFLIWNRPPARLFLGNSGSSAISTTVAVLFACHWSLLPTPGALGGLAPFAWPIADLVFVSVRRLRAGRRPWHGGKDHTTHELARALGSDRYVWLCVAGSAGLGLLAAELLR
jgi:UDP-N-acetylmuramyl pentapeptide phosphotransferase/UDP-N-acetylglucosamine-1-phosphate transferase